jgi:hypothetical protein
LKIIAEINRNNTVLEYRKHPKLKTQNNFKISMNFGLHAGWAIEGAVGSLHKIDATYLSPHVNLTSRLQSSSRQYGVSLLASHDFVELLTTKNSHFFRKIDVVNVKGSEVPMPIYTYDVLLEQDFDFEKKFLIEKEIEKQKQRKQSIATTTIDTPNNTQQQQYRKHSIDTQATTNYNESPSQNSARRKNSVGFTISNIYHHNNNNNSNNNSNNNNDSPSLFAASRKKSQGGLNLLYNFNNNNNYENSPSQYSSGSKRKTSTGFNIFNNSNSSHKNSYKNSSQQSEALRLRLQHLLHQQQQQGDCKYYSCLEYTNNIFDFDLDLKYLRSHINDYFLVNFEKGFKHYINGNWRKARDYFIVANKAMIVSIQCEDGPTNTLLKYMASFNFEKPKDWKGFRKLESK